MESKTRTVVKAGIWTVIGFLSMSLVGYIMTGSIALGGVMAVLNALIGMVSYFVYERLWAGISWGRNA